MISIKQDILTDELKSSIYNALAEYSTQKLGFDGAKDDPVSFAAFDGENFAGAAVAELFFGQLHIKYLVVEKVYRGRGLARDLVERTLDYGRENGCSFAYVATLSFQAPEFYAKLGFIPEYTRPGYAGGVSFHYLRRDL